VKEVNPKDARNTLYRVIGALIIALNYFRHKIMGYRTPRTFSAAKIQHSVDYDLRIADDYLKYLTAYSRNNNFIYNKIVLELGPGPDLGVGLALLAAGAKKYIAFDAHNLSNNTPVEFYDYLVNSLEKRTPSCNTPYLKDCLNCIQRDDNPIRYITDSMFDISKVEDEIDIVVSNAAFEHFIDTRKTVQQLSQLVKKDGVLAISIDLKTHSAWIRDRDPLNIYRYSESFWNTFRFDGSPNRLRAYEYKMILEELGWKNIKIVPSIVLDLGYLMKVQSTLNKRFSVLPPEEMQILSVAIMATR